MTFFPSRTSAFHDIIPAFTHLRKSLDAPVDSVVVNSSIEESSVLLAYLCFLLSIGPLQVAFPISTLQLRAFTPEKAFPPLPPARRRARTLRAAAAGTHRFGNFGGIVARARGDRGDQLAAITVPQSIEYTQHIRTRASSYKQRRGQK